MEQQTTPLQNELIATRLINATQEQVYYAWTDPVLLAQWWGPRGFTNTFHTFDLQPGGSWRYTMHAPNGGNFNNESVFVDLTPVCRIIIDHVSAPEFRLIATFDDQHNKTLVTFRQIFPSVEACNKVRHFAEEANHQNLERLEQVLAKTHA